MAGVKGPQPSHGMACRAHVAAVVQGHPSAAAAAQPGRQGPYMAAHGWWRVLGEVCQPKAHTRGRGGVSQGGDGGNACRSELGLINGMGCHGYMA